MNLLRTSIALFLVTFLFAGCKKTETTPKLIFKFKFDPTQQRYDSFGQPANTLPAGHAGQNPLFNAMSAHYIELAPLPSTLLGKGVVLYKAPETNAGGSNAIDFKLSSLTTDNGICFETPLSAIPAGEYEWLRISLAYQNYDIKYYIDTTINNFQLQGDYTGTISSFIGFNSYVESYKIKSQDILINGNVKQGYWGFETSLKTGANTVPFTTSGQAPEGATTVVNPLFSTSPVPAGSCVVAAAFNPGKLMVSGKETKDIVITVSLSTNKSFEWKDLNNNHKWEPRKGEPVVDMGIRGMIPFIQ